MAQRRYSIEVKTEAVRRYREDGVSVRVLADELGASPTTVRRWVDHSRRHGGPDASSRHAADCTCIVCFRLAHC